MNNGRIDPQAVKKLLTPDVSFMSIALANHELGYIQPVEEIAEVVSLYTSCKRLSKKPVQSTGFLMNRVFDDVLLSRARAHYHRRKSVSRSC